MLSNSLTRRDRARDFACIVGAPRSGTTSLASFLQDHPNVCFSTVKEPHFFSQRDFSRLATDELRKVVEDQYLARYFPHRVDGQLLAEGSVSYLYAPEQMGPILECWPNAKFIIAVRDPLEMLPSLHRRLLYIGDEAVEEFERAWALMPERMSGRSIPATCIDPRFLQYEAAARLGTHVEAFFRAVGRERCFVAVFDDLASNPAALYDELLDFLRLPPHPRQDFAPRRSSRGFRFGWLQRLLKRPPVVTRKVLAGKKYRQRVKAIDDRPDSALVRGILRARKMLLSWNQAPPPPVQMSPALRAEICKALAGEVAHLSQLLDRDLSHWLDGAPRALLRERSAAVETKQLTSAGPARESPDRRERGHGGSRSVASP